MFDLKLNRVIFTHLKLWVAVARQPQVVTISKLISLVYSLNYLVNNQFTHTYIVSSLAPFIFYLFQVVTIPAHIIWKGTVLLDQM